MDNGQSQPHLLSHFGPTKELQTVSRIGNAPKMRKFYSVAISNGIENVRDKMSDQLMVEIPGPQTCSKANSEHTDNLRKWS